jgi:hypothetical protein
MNVTEMIKEARIASRNKTVRKFIANAVALDLQRLLTADSCPEWLTKLAETELDNRHRVANGMKKMPEPEIAARHKELGFALTHFDRAAGELRYAIENIKKAENGNFTVSCHKLDDAIKLIESVREYATGARREMMSEYSLPY